MHSLTHPTPHAKTSIYIGKGLRHGVTRVTHRTVLDTPGRSTSLANGALACADGVPIHANGVLHCADGVLTLRSTGAALQAAH
ncbi:hypothetical protein Nepgr_030433 [Nepenthes gracilis]|uniref:Uncharacterized protein n=1 Tax=Nepenthes gracilis TaxID=150966 RepID=A0AAD3Y5R8_NEPGR|nr:hypothetical protein Nepgr_030433 [Nepenthes gracilis]